MILPGRHGLCALAAFGLAVACTDDTEPVDDCCSVEVRITVPEQTGTVYLTGNLDELGPWVPDKLAMQGSAGERSATVTVPPGLEFEYKFTLGSWEREALGPSGTVMPNFRHSDIADAVVTHNIERFRVGPEPFMDDWQSSGVLGTLVYWKDLQSEYLDRSRHVVIWLPPGYEDDTASRYPVLYMQDGQNLFDARIGGSDGNVWDVDDAIVRLVDSGAMSPVIVVGAFNTADRFPEYSPWHRASDYARFLIEELMPRINREFRTLSGPANTSIMGSSMGGLLSWYMVTHHPDVFGACGCVSSHFSLSEEMFVRFTTGRVTDDALDSIPYILYDIEADKSVPSGVRYWFDYGTKGLDADYGGPHAAIRDWYLRQGLEENRDFVIREYAGADHNEASWRDRLDDPLLFLYGQQD
mgnify:CR=1 FL=1